MNKEYYETVEKIKFELEKIRPKLIMDGGNIEFINYAIEKTLIEKIPEIKKVLQVKMSVV